MGDGGSSRVGVVGVGRMGLPVCRNLARGGYGVVAWDRDVTRAEAVRAAGAGWAASLTAVAAGVDVVVTVLPGPRECREVMLDAGLLDALPPGTTWIDMTSNAPAAAAGIRARAEDRGMDVLEAPMGGGPPEASASTLQLFAGGRADVLDRHRPLLETLADPARITHVGGAGAGYVAKLLNNLLWFTQSLATTEALLLAKSVGVDLDALLTAFSHGAARSAYLEAAAPAHLSGDLMPSFALDRVCEELATLADLARDHGTPFELGALVHAVHARALETYGPQDGELLGARFLEDSAGTRLTRRTAGDRPLE